jgi:hypothetical protein
MKTAKIPIPQVQPATPPEKFSSGAPHIVQADGFFNNDSHAFNNANRAETRANRALRDFLRNATRKMPAHSPHLLCCTLLPLCLVSGSVVEESTMQLSPFTDNLS